MCIIAMRYDEESVVHMITDCSGGGGGGCWCDSRERA